MIAPFSSKFHLPLEHQPLHESFAWLSKPTWWLVRKPLQLCLTKRFKKSQPPLHCLSQSRHIWQPYARQTFMPFQRPTPCTLPLQKLTPLDTFRQWTKLMNWRLPCPLGKCLMSMSMSEPPKTFSLSVALDLAATREPARVFGHFNVACYFSDQFYWYFRC